MGQPSSKDEMTIRHQFDRLCQMALKGEAVNSYKHMDYRRKHEVTFSELSEKELSKLFTMDEYGTEYHHFEVHGYDIEVKNTLIAEALKELSERKRNVILLSYFMEMSDADIAREMNLVRSSIHEHRTRSLEILKKIIPQFEKLIATIRSREISASIILQSKSQLKALYRDNASTIEGNCDTTLFLGGKEKDTLKDLAEILGKETIDLYNTSDTRGTSQSYGLNYQKTGKELMSQDEIAVMDGSKCIMQLRGVRPFFSDKFDITKHKQYPLLSDYDKKNEFDIEKYVKNRNRLRFKRNDVVDEVCDVGEITA